MFGQSLGSHHDTLARDNDHSCKRRSQSAPNMRYGLGGGGKVVPERRICLLTKRRGEGCFTVTIRCHKGFMSTKPQPASTQLP